MGFPTVERTIEDNTLGLRLTVIRMPSEVLLMTAYLLLKRDGILPFFWYSNWIPSPSEFLAVCARPDCVPYIAMLGSVESETLDVVGLAFAQNRKYIGDIGSEPAFIGEVSMAFVKTAQGLDSRVARELCELALDDGFKNLGFISLFGCTPVQNAAAIRFIKSMKFRVIGIAPNYANWRGTPTDCVLSVMERAQWFSELSTTGQVEANGGTQ